MNVPLSFEPNQGQAASTVQFLSRGAGYALFLTPAKVVLNLERQQPASAAATGQTPEAASVDTLRMSLIGANANANAVGLVPQPGVVNYFIGNDPKKWRTGIPTYGKVNYAQIYPGVDLVFYGNQRQLEYDFVVAPGADPSRIAWRIDGARASVDAEGNLALNAPNGPASFKKPVLYQMDGNKKTSVEGSFEVAGNQIRFRLGGYDHSRALIIDPVLSYASYLGGAGTDQIGYATDNARNGTSQGLAVDSAGSAYVTGNTLSIDFPTKNPYQGAPPTKQQGVPPGQWATAFVTKFSPDGSSLVYSTYLGGNGAERAYAIAVDSSNSAYVTGLTYSTDFPITPGAYQTVCAPIPNNTGIGFAAANCNAFDWNVFVTKLNPAGTGLVYSTFLGGYGNWAYGTAIAVDGAGRAYVAGNEDDICSTSYTFQSCFPTTSGAVIGGDKPGGRSAQYAFVAVFDPTGAHLLYSTLFGDLNYSGGGDAWATGIAVDANGYFYLVGETKAGRLPTTAGVIQPTSGPLDSGGLFVQAWRGFIAKFNPVTSSGGASQAYGTYLGGHTGNLGDYISGIAIDSASNAYVVGYTNSKDFPVTQGAYSTVCGPSGGTCAAAHVTKLNPSATSILWSTYVGDATVGGSDAVFFTGPIQLDGAGNVYIIGQTGGGPGFPMVNPVEPTPTGGSQQVLVAELDPTGLHLLFSTTIGSHGLNTTNPAGLAVDTAGNIFLAGNTAGPDLITTPGAFQTTSSDGACCQKGNGFVAKIAPSSAQITGVTDAAGYQQGISPGAWIVIWGANLSSTTRSWLDSEVINGKLPTQLDGVSVTIDGKPSAVHYISPGQLNVQAPDDTTTGPVQVVVTAPQGTATTTATMQTVSPGLFMYDAANVAAQHVGYSIVAPAGLYPGSTPARPGEVIILYATGFGPTLPPTPSGQIVPSAPVVDLSAINLTIGGRPAQVQWAGIVGAGLWQLNVQVPPDVPAGNAAVVAQIGGKSTQGGAFIAVQAP
ncbi:MAG: SBBP repeat-containing protein [Bryobacteraceae bacterium]|jgi:uncharacterized protein (TIGR03437 family)